MGTTQKAIEAATLHNVIAHMLIALPGAAPATQIDTPTNHMSFPFETELFPNDTTRAKSYTMTRAELTQTAMSTTLQAARYSYKESTRMTNQERPGTGTPNGKMWLLWDGG